MKNYIGFYIILILLFIIMVYNGYEMNRINTALTESAYELRDSSDEDYGIMKETYDGFKKKFDGMETEITTLINHSLYKDISNSVSRIGYDIEFMNRYYLKRDIDELIYYLEEIKSGEKLSVNNIF